MLRSPYIPRSPFVDIFGPFTEIEKGVFMAPKGNFHIIGNLSEFPDLKDVAGDLQCFGICDAIEQFMKRYKGALVESPRKFAVAFQYVPKEVDLDWGKWGPYIGNGTISKDLLSEESGFENGVYCYSIYELH